MAWYDMEWYDKAWYSIVWYDMAWYSMAWYDMAWFIMAWYDMGNRFITTFKIVIYGGPFVRTCKLNQFLCICLRMKYNVFRHMSYITTACDLRGIQQEVSYWH